MSRFISRWLPAVLVMGAIFFFSSISAKEMPVFGVWDLIVKKSGHMLGYALLGIAYMRGINSRMWWAYLAAVLGVLIYALSDEFHQSFVPGRDSSLIDVGIDTAGAVLGMLCLRFIPVIRKIIFIKP